MNSLHPDPDTVLYQAMHTVFCARFSFPQKVIMHAGCLQSNGKFKARGNYTLFVFQ